MNKILIAVIDSVEARFLTLELADFFDPDLNARLVEVDTLLNPAGNAQGNELWSSTKTGRNRGVSGQAHSYDDHRQQHEAEFERRFAHTITRHISEFIAQEPIQRFILVAAPQIAGVMREAIAPVLPEHLQTSELVKHLNHLKAHELHQYLANQQLVPEPIRTP